jgi:transcriptional regulator with XRE-family HTH domain
VIACSRLDDMVDSEIRRYGKLLEAVVKLSDLSTRELERRLDLGGGTLNRIFTGKIDLKLRHILLVLEVVGMKPERFFQLACARPAAGDEAGSALAAEILESFQRFGYSIGRPPAPLPDRQLSDEELDRRIEAALGRVLGRTAPEAADALPTVTALAASTAAAPQPSSPAAPAGRRSEPGPAAPGKPAGDPSSD